jgi:hypothetical protein
MGAIASSQLVASSIPYATVLHLVEVWVILLYLVGHQVVLGHPFLLSTPTYRLLTDAVIKALTGLRLHSIIPAKTARALAAS